MRYVLGSGVGALCGLRARVGAGGPGAVGLALALALGGCNASTDAMTGGAVGITGGSGRPPDCSERFPQCGPGSCGAGGAYTDACQSYAPDSPVSLGMCHGLANPQCGVGCCTYFENGTASYCDGASCPAPRCYAASSPVSQTMCPTCGDGVQNQGETQVDCGGPCEPCGPCDCDESNACVDGSFCTSAGCEPPTSPLSQALCGYHPPGSPLDPATCGVGCCTDGHYCNDCVCLTEEKSEEVCRLLNPGCCWISQGASTQYGSFQRVYMSDSYEHARGGLQTSSGGYLMTGSTASGALTVLTNAVGDVAWSVRGPMLSGTEAIEVPGGFVVSGLAYDSVAMKTSATLTKLDPSGALLWHRQFGEGSEAGTVRAMANGDLLVAGQFADDAFVTRTDASGNALWSYRYGVESPGVIETVRSVIPTADGGALVFGATGFGYQTIDLLLFKIDGAGNLLWAETIGGLGQEGSYSSAYDSPFRMSPTADGGAVLAAWTRSWGAGSNDVFVAKVTGSGAVTWARAIGGAGDDQGMVPVETPEGDVLVMGEEKSYVQGIFLMSLDASGTLQWARSFGSDPYYNSMDGGAAAGGGAYIITESHSLPVGNAGHWFYLLQTTEQGSAGCCAAQSISPTVTEVSPIPVNVTLTRWRGPAVTSQEAAVTPVELTTHTPCL